MLRLRSRLLRAALASALAFAFAPALLAAPPDRERPGKVRPHASAEAREGPVARPAPAGEEDFSWLLEPKVFNWLSSAGQRAALRLNGLLKMPAKAAPSKLRPEAVAPLAAPAPLDNIRVNDPAMDETGRTNSESHIAVRGSTIIVGFNDAAENGDGYSYSTDGGGTWKHKRIPTFADGFNLGDPVVAFGPNGEIYYASLAYNSARKSTIGVAKSTDGGATFGTPADAATTAVKSADFQDKPWMAVDANASSAKKGNVYVSWTDFTGTVGSHILFSRSTDGGVTFGAPVPLSPDDGSQVVQGSNPAVAPNGDLYIAFFDGKITPDGGISIVKSTDGGVTFGASVKAAGFLPIGSMTGGDGVRSNSFPMMAVDKNGAVHFVYGAVSPGSTQDRSDCFYIRSTDGGATFSAPRKLNDDGTPTSQLFPSIAALSDGTLGAKWWDRRNDPTNDGLTDVYMTFSTDGGATWGKNFRITNHNWLFGPVEAGYASGYHGDYDGLAADGNSFYLSWSDERGTDPDVYFAYIPKGTNASAPDFNVSAQTFYAVVKAGQSVDYNVLTSAFNGFGASVTLSAASQQTLSGASFSFTNATISAGQTTKLTVATTSAALPGSYLLTVTATGGGLTRKTNLRLVVYDAARTFELPANISGSPGFTLQDRGLVIDASGVWHVVYEDDTNNVTAYDVVYRRSTDGGRTFSAPRTVSTNSPVSFDSTAVVDGTGKIHTVFTSYDTTAFTYRIYHTKSADGGSTFSTPVPVSPANQFSDYGALAVDKNGNILVVWYEESGTSAKIYSARSTNGGATFTDPPLLLADDKINPGARPGLAFDSGGAGTPAAYLVFDGFTTTPTTKYTIRLAIAADGQSFTTIAGISDSSIANAFGPSLAVDKNDNLYVSFYNRYGSTSATYNREVMLIKSTNHGGAFSPQVNVSNNSGQSTFPSIAVDGKGGVNVAWEDTTFDPKGDVYFARSTDGGATFGASQSLSANSGVSNQVSATVDGAGNVYVAWLDDTPANPEVLVAKLQTAAANNPPTAAITSPAPGFTAEAGVAVAFVGTGTDPDGDPLTYSWSFGDGTTGSGAAPEAHPFAAPGTYTAVLTVRDPQGATATASRPVTITAPTVTGTSLLLPVVLEAGGLGGSFYTSEVTLVSRVTSTVQVLLSYTASAGSGSGVARVTLAPGEQRVISGIISFLRTKSLAIPADGSAQVGTLLVTFGGAPASAVFAGARTFTPDPTGVTNGTFGLFYPAIPSTGSSATLFGLQQNDKMRSNVAVVNTGSDPITVRVQLSGANNESLGALPDQPLGPYGWYQFNQPLSGKASSGRAVVTRVSGGSPFSAYGVLNDAATSDGSYIAPLLGGDSSGADRLVPIVLDVFGAAGSHYTTELTFTNFTASALPLTLVYTAAATLGTGSGNVSLTLDPGEQRIVPDAIAFLRGTLAIPTGVNVGGSLLVKAPSGTAASSLAVGARTFTPGSPTGTYGLFYSGLTFAESASATAWIYGLQQNDKQRSNVAIVNRGDAGDTITLQITYFSPTGVQLGAPVSQSLAPGAWVQFNTPLQPFGAIAGYARVDRVSGNSRWAAYGVLNDQVTSDGSYIAFSQ